MGSAGGSQQIADSAHVPTCLARQPLQRDDIAGAGAGLLHTDFMHLAGSLLPWAVLACLLERSYGSARVIALWLVSLLGGAFTSAVLDSSCQVVRAGLP